MRSISSFPKRDQYTRWHNERPVKDIHELLELLRPGHHDSTDGRYIKIDGHKVEVQIGWFTYGSSGGDRSGFHYYQVEQKTVDELRKNAWVAPRRISRVGYTETQHNKLGLTNKGEGEFKRFLAEQEEKAKALLVPGKHSKFSALFERYDHGRTYGKYGELYFLFRTPMDERVRVFPRLKKVRKLRKAA
ncbi:MAG: hypothetical protein V4474_02800 [Patescibacteria group bacterium]